jgi:phosphoglycolate phosphatase
MNDAKQKLGQSPALIFDLDGTLMHTEPDIRKAINGALRDCGYQELPPELVLPNLYSMLPEIIAQATAMIGVPASAQHDLHEAYRVHYAEQAHENSCLFPGVMDFLNTSAARGCVMGVCTNKNEAFARQALSRHGIDHFFACITGGNSTAHCKPHPLPLQHTLGAMAATAANTIMIGDTHVDAEVAQNTGVAFALYLNGYGGANVHDYPAVAKFESFLELN